MFSPAFTWRCWKASSRIMASTVGFSSLSSCSIPWQRFFVYCYPCIREFIFNLIWLVTYLLYIALVIGQYIASAFTLVPPTEGGYIHSVFFVIALSDIRYVASYQFHPQQGCPHILLERQNSLTGASPSQRVYFASIPLSHKAMIGDIASDIS